MADDLDELLVRLSNRPDATFRPGQREAIEALIEGGRRVLCVQRTGWGKSAVYFVATAVLRGRGTGPTILVSPLLALMRNQIEMADRLGIRARTLNSSNRDSWPEVFEELERDQVDVILVSPERFANQEFREHHLPQLLAPCRLFVIDEAHCISDWGHDFRPDYRRIARLVDDLPADASVLCTTATANDRVVADLVDQLGTEHELLTIRGSLDRLSLRLETVDLAHQAERLAWLATYVPTIEGSGIVYCLTVRDTRVVAEWLQGHGIAAVNYAGPDDDEDKIEIEQRLLRNEIKVVAATSALAMGYDKPDLAFVIHFQTPGSPIAYYQQVGRAGRAIENAHGVLLKGAEDREIQNYFIRQAFPPPDQIDLVIARLESEADGATSAELLTEVNIGSSRLEALLKSLEVDDVVERDGKRWTRTAEPFHYDAAHVENVLRSRRLEVQAMERFGTDDRCLMLALRTELDDEDALECGRCAVCVEPRFAEPLDDLLIEEAKLFLRGRPITLEPRKRWPIDRGEGVTIPAEERVEPGRALAIYGDAGWGHHVSRGKFTDGAFSDELVTAGAALLSEWSPDPFPTWITNVPSLRRPGLVPSFCERLAETLGIEFRPAVRKIRETLEQKQMENSVQQSQNVEDAFQVDGFLGDAGPVLLVDDIVDSRWTMTEVGRALRLAGVEAVHPLALASSATGGS